MKSLNPGAHIPWAQINTYLDPVLELDLVPEIAIKGPELDNIDQQQLEAIAQTLSGKSLRPTVHAPFFDLNPGALDPLIREVTFTRLSQSLAVAGKINAHLMVIHPGVDKWRYPNLQGTWCDLAAEFFPALIEQAAAIDCRLAIENIYEESPDYLVQLVERIDSEWFGHCFDIGHWHLFGKRPMHEWLEKIGPKLFHLHLHDNHGRADEHLPVGAGTIDFTPLEKHLCSSPTSPSMTLEAHSRDDLISSLHQVQRLLG